MATDKLAKQGTTSIVSVDVDFTSIKEALIDSGEEFGVFDFTRIQLPAGNGAAVFNIETLDGPQTPKTIECVILDQQRVKSYFKDAYTGESNPPDCLSADGLTGIGEPGGNCEDCPLNQFGSDGNGKACSDRRHVLLLVEGEMFPLFLNVPPSSIKNFSKYLKALVLKGIKVSNAITIISLNKTKSGGGIEYAELVFTYNGLIDEQQKAIVQQYKDALGGILAQHAMARPEPPFDVSAHTKG